MFLYITGVSGAGKTTLCRQLEPLGIVPLGGSERIMAYHGLTDLQEYAHATPRTNLSRASAYWRHCHEVDQDDPHTIRAMDYHWHLYKPSGAFPVPIYPFDRHNLLGIILLEPPCLLIRQRRERSYQERPDRRMDREEIREEVALENHYTNRAVRKLRCPSLVLPNISMKRTLKSVQQFVAAVRRVSLAA